MLMEDNSVKNDEVKKTEVVKKKSGGSLLLVIFFLLVIGCLSFFGLNYHNNEMKKIKDKCSPVKESSEAKELDLDNPLVIDLYEKVATSLREDLANFELNDQMKLYLAFRQIPSYKIYESNCNMFVNAGIEPFTCNNNDVKAFKEETLKLELIKLFGEDNKVNLGNIQLGKSCIGGFQYIAGRGEFVQGHCANDISTMYSMKKELVGATSTNSTIVLRENVKYYGTEGLDVPLRSGVYVYTFKLDMNYNYVYVSKTFEE